MRTSVWPPRAVGFETSTSRQWYGAFSYSKNIFRLMSIASIRLAIAPSLLTGGFAPPDPPSPSLAGAPCPAPLRRGAPAARYRI